MSECLFCKIIKGEIPTNIIYKDDLVIAFDDIRPKAPVHKLIVPREHIESLNDVLPEHNALLGHMMQVIKKITLDTHIDKKGYRVIINCNKEGGQEIFHLHMHLLGGRSLNWTPG